VKKKYKRRWKVENVGGKNATPNKKWRRLQKKPGRRNKRGEELEQEVRLGESDFGGARCLQIVAREGSLKVGGERGGGKYRRIFTNGGKSVERVVMSQCSWKKGEGKTGWELQEKDPDQEAGDGGQLER